MSFKKTYKNLDTNSESAKYDSNQNLTYDRNLPLRVQRENQPSWNLIEDLSDIKIYNKGNSFVLVCYTDLAGEVDFLSGQINTDGVNFGNKGGNQPTLFRKNINTFLTDYTNIFSGAVAVFNSAFFSNSSLTTPNPTQMAFPYKDGNAQHDGYELDSSITTRKLFVKNSFGFNVFNYVDPTSSQITEGYSLAKFYGSNNLGYIMGLSVADTTKTPSSSVGRTIIACRDDDGDNIKETFVALISSSSTQQNAINEIKEFGIIDENICILDGGGSSQFETQNQNYIGTGRTLPTCIGVRN